MLALGSLALVSLGGVQAMPPGPRVVQETPPEWRNAQEGRPEFRDAQEIPPVLRVDVTLEGRSRAVDIYRPAGVPLGVAVIAHGFARSRARHADLGRALAAWGVTAVIPDLPNVLNLWGNGDAIVELVGKLERGEVAPMHVARGRIVLVGTSAGGLATVLAAAQLPGIAGWVGLDPVDRTGTGAAAAAQVASPAVVMLAEPSLCNLVTSGEAIAEALPHRLRTLTVTGASHCDFEDPTNAMCEAACGHGSAEVRATIRTEVVTTVRELLAHAIPDAAQTIPDAARATRDSAHGPRDAAHARAGIVSTPGE